MHLCQPGAYGRRAGGRRDRQSNTARSPYRTSVGYGAIEKLSDEEIFAGRAQAESAAKRCDWVDQTIDPLRKQTNSKLADTLRGKGLAEAWKQMDDANLKDRAKADIMVRWQVEGWWDSPPGKFGLSVKAVHSK